MVVVDYGEVGLVLFYYFVSLTVLGWLGLWIVAICVFVRFTFCVCVLLFVG